MSELLGALQAETFARATTATASSYPPERRLTAAQLASYLDRRVFAVVGACSLMRPTVRCREPRG